MNPLRNETVTVFNKITSRRGTDKWVATVLENVHVERSRSHLMKKYGKETNNKILLILDSENYIPPKEWKRSSKGFTFNEDIDLVFLGKWEGEKTFDSDTFEQEMLDNSDNFYTVHTVSQFTLIPHLEVACG